MIEPAFTVAEVEKILYVKEFIKAKTADFVLTIRKLGMQADIDFYVTGGCTASLLQGGTPKDIDVYFCNPIISEKVVSLYMSDSYKNEVAVFNEKYRDVEVGKIVLTENALTLKNGIQIIFKHHGVPNVLRKTFDYVHCLPYYTPVGDKLYISREQYDCCVNKILKNNRPDTKPAEWRTQKFLARGYKYGEGEVSPTTNS